jgi:transcriptional regulator with XRE-family HTH domain
MNIGKNLKRLRRKRGLTQQALAEKVGITQVYVAYLEGGRTPSLPMLQRLAKALKVKVGKLLE